MSHRCLHVIEYVAENNVILLSVPPHFTHKSQPLDVTVYSLFKTNFDKEIFKKWQKRNPARIVSFFEIGEIMGIAYLKSATPSNAINGFQENWYCNC